MMKMCKGLHKIVIYQILIFFFYQPSCWALDEGQWTGTTDQGYTIVFEVTGNKIQNLTLGVYFADADYGTDFFYTDTTLNGTGQLDYQFTWDAGWQEQAQITGLFKDNTSASGTWSVTVDSHAADGTWTAAKTSDMAIASTSEFISFSSELKTKTSFDSPGPLPRGVAYDGSGLWISDRWQNKIYYTTLKGEVISSIPAPGESVAGIAFDGNFLWSVDTEGKKIYKIDTNGNILLSFPSPGPKPVGISFDGQSLWHVDQLVSIVYQLDTKGRILKQFASPAKSPRAIVFDDPYLWITAAEGIQVCKIDLSGQIVYSFIPPGTGPSGMTIINDTLWIADWMNKKLYCMIPENEQFIGETRTLSIPIANTGNKTMAITDVILSGEHAHLFNIKESDCLNNDILPGEFCEILVEFKPVAPGSVHGVIDISTDISQSTVMQVVLNGNGQLPGLKYVIDLMNHLTLKQTNGNMTYFDINKDGRINLEEVLYSLQILNHNR